MALERRGGDWRNLLVIALAGLHLDLREELVDFFEAFIDRGGAWRMAFAD